MAKDDSVLQDGPRDGTTFAAGNATLLELEINGMVHRYIRTKHHQELAPILAQVVRPRFEESIDDCRNLCSKRSWRLSHQGTVVGGRSAWRSTGELVRWLSWTTISVLVVMVPPVERKRRCRVSGVAVA
jgi:hypothetical protein